MQNHMTNHRPRPVPAPRRIAGRRIRARRRGHGAGLRDSARQPGSRGALGQHRPLQPRRPGAVAEPRDPRRPELRRRRPQLRQRLDRHQPVRRAVRIRRRLAPAIRIPRQRRRLVRLRLQQPRQHVQRDREHAGQRPAGRRRAEPVHEALRQGRVGRMAGRVRVRELRPVRHSVQPQGRPAHGLLGRQPAPGRRDPRRLVRAESARRLEGIRDAGKRGEGAVPAARRDHAAGAADEGSVGRGAVVLQLAGGSHPGIGKLPDDPGPAQLRRRLVHRRTESARGRESRSPEVPAPLARLRHQAARELGQPRRLGIVGALEPGMARRHAGRLLSQHDRRLSAGDGDARASSRRRRRPARRAGARRCPAARFASSIPTPRRSPTCRSTASSGSTTAPTATTSTSTA